MLDKTAVLVSVVMPVFNAAGELGECLESLASQTLGSAEFIIVDDGSADDSGDIAERFALVDKRFSVVRQENMGPGAARNHGAELAAGKYIIFLDCDDIYEPDMLSIMSGMLERSGADAVLCNSDSFDGRTGAALVSEWMNRLPETGCYPAAELNDRLFQTVHGWPWDKMFRRMLISDNNLRYPDLPNSQDLVFVYAALAASERICVTDRVLVHHRMNRGGSVSNSRAGSAGAPFRAVRLLTEELTRLDRLGALEKSMYRWCMNFWLWHCTTLSGSAQDQAIAILRSKEPGGVRFGKYPDPIYDKNDLRLYRRIKRFPGMWRAGVKFRSALKKLLPMPAASVRRENEELMTAVGACSREIIRLNKRLSQLETQLQEKAGGSGQ